MNEKTKEQNLDYMDIIDPELSRIISKIGEEELKANAPKEPMTPERLKKMVEEREKKETDHKKRNIVEK